MAKTVYTTETNGLRKCNRCASEKPVSEFSKVSSKHVTPGLLARCCKTCNHKRVVSIRRKKVYGVSDEKYQEMLVNQSGRCAICGRKQEDLKASRGLAIDHDHSSGKVRGLLCAKCNTAIGLFDDLPERMIAAIRYLENSNGC